MEVFGVENYDTVTPNSKFYLKPLICKLGIVVGSD